MEGDEELLAATEVKEEPKRDEWMTTLPPERKVSPVNHLFLPLGKLHKCALVYRKFGKI